ncbi:hypothetical protein ACX9NE_17065 [Mycobacterium sp. ML4]
MVSNYFAQLLGAGNVGQSANEALLARVSAAAEGRQDFVVERQAQSQATSAADGPRRH